MLGEKASEDLVIHAIVEYIKVIDKHNIIIFLNATGNYNHVEAREMIPSENESKSIFVVTVKIKNPRKNRHDALLCQDNLKPTNPVCRNVGLLVVGNYFNNRA